jgi:hypothetical protein
MSKQTWTAFWHYNSQPLVPYETTAKCSDDFSELLDKVVEEAQEAAHGSDKEITIGMLVKGSPQTELLGLGRRMVRL